MNIIMERSNKTRSERAQLGRKKRNRLIIAVNLVLLGAITTTVILTYNMKQDKSGAELPKLAAVHSKEPQKVDAGVKKTNDGGPSDQKKSPNTVKPVGTEDSKRNQTNNGKTPDSGNNKAVISGGNNKPQVLNADSNQKTKVVYLTFDDGPNEYTEQILNILKENEIHATFFMIGTQLRDNQSSIERLLKEGHYAGLHSMSHNYNKLYKNGGSSHFIDEFKQEQALLYKLTGFKATLIRAPYGSAPQIGYNFRTDIAHAGFKMWDWTVDSQDWSYTGKPDKVVQQVKRQIHRKQEIILMHEKKQTVQALPRIIAYLKQKGYSFAVYKPDHHIVSNFGKDTRL
ncbi:polysaccharide deacetylase family protein [Paenibacillus sp. J22TS3]|uniref:polysaccharide deacetylase family protein n=1 Tax=Paenibacillus sp. J22TS3 TaxID=2807192 RepID=UPI001AFE1854|nr:polysaccharide deacetylase family protein [Paenibacillus sp. J22TS3]GIP19853.1 hypothetical protein J22TS3_01280 [Paenibacillus sp. J22TS3]